MQSTLTRFIPVRFRIALPFNVKLKDFEMKIFEKFDKLNNNQKHIIKFSIGFVCFITFITSLVLSYVGIVLPVKIICGMFVFFVLSFVVYIIWRVTGYDD